MTNQGAQAQQTNGHPLGTDKVVDLDELLAAHSLDPVPVKLKGKTYKVRRDLTGAQVADCWKLINAGKDTEALAMLVSSPVMLSTALDKLPQSHMKIAVRKILAAAGMVDDEADAAGK